MPPGGIAKLWSLRRLYPRAGAAVGGHAGPVQHADQGQRLRGRVCLSNGPAGGLAGPHGLGHAGRAHRAGQRGLRPAAAQRRELHRRVHHGRGRLGHSLLRRAHRHRHRRRGRAVVHRARVGQRGPAELSHRNHGQHVDHQQHGQRRELHHGGRRVHGDIDGLGRGELRSHRALTGATLTITGAASAGPLDCESLDCTFTATSGGVSTGSVVCGDVTSSGTVSAPQLFASNTLIVTNTSDFSDDLFLTKNWAGWSKLQVSNNSAASDSGPELRLLGNQSARVFLERDGGTHQCELIMINDEASTRLRRRSPRSGCADDRGGISCQTWQALRSHGTDLAAARAGTSSQAGAQVPSLNTLGVFLHVPASGDANERARIEAAV